MSNITIRHYIDSDQEKVIQLWELCNLTRSWNDPIKDIQRKLTVQNDLFLVLEVDGEILGSIMGGFDGHRGSVNYLGIHPDHKELIQIGCPKINLMVRNSNLDVQEFYQDIGYEEQDVVVFGKRLIPD